jgi:acetyl-CoA carboxylase biotin carboxyl carrier protein
VSSNNFAASLATREINRRDARNHMARRETSKETPTAPITGSANTPGDIFDVRKVRRLVELMNEYDLSEIDLRQADQRIRLRRGPETIAVSASPSLGTPAPPSHPTHLAGEAASAAGKQAVDDSKFTLIRSPMVGTFYASPNPDSAPFVKVGDQIGPETTVCVIEAMKVFNEIPAECSGKIVAALVENGEPVEFSQPLFRVEPNV